MKDNDFLIISILLVVIVVITWIACINIGFDAGEISGRKKASSIVWNNRRNAKLNINT